MSLFGYASHVPCYQTGVIERYQSDFIREASRLFELTREQVFPEHVDHHCRVYEGSFSIIATSTDETAAKIVMYQEGIGRWLGNDPDWNRGVYVWVRANDNSGRAFEIAAQDHNFAHGWVLTRFEQNRAVSVAPNPSEHFYYFRMGAEDDRSRIAQLLAFCATL